MKKKGIVIAGDGCWVDTYTVHTTQWAWGKGCCEVKIDFTRKIMDG